MGIFLSMEHARLLKTMRTKPLAQWNAKDYTIAILAGIAVGAITVSVLTAPNLVQVFTLFKTHNKKNQHRVAQKMRYLNRAGYIEKKQNVYQLTKKGNRYLNEEYVWNLIPKIPKRWNGKWYFVTFDIPGEKQYERPRQALRARLNELGFVRYQDSLMVHQYDMREIIEPFSAFYGIRRFLTFIVADKIDGAETISKQCLIPKN